MLKNKIIKVLLFICLVIFIIIKLNIPNEILKIIYPVRYENFVEKYANMYNVDKNLIYAIIKAESNFNEKAESSKGAKGLMQLMESTAKYIIKADKLNDSNINLENIGNDILDAQTNIRLGTSYISLLINKYNCIELALVAYNAGSGNVDNWIEQGLLNADGSNIEQVPYKETNNYVRKILRDYKIYKQLYGI